jgi:ABC-type antimicrobial peptide transport system permease subunit
MRISTLSNSFTIIGFNNEKELENLKNGESVAFWSKNDFESISPKQALQAFQDNPRGIFLPSDYLYYLDTAIGESIDIRISVIDSETDAINKVKDIEILGIVNQLPGGINRVPLVSQELFLEFKALTMNKSATAFQQLELNASRYLLRTTEGDAITEDQIDAIEADLENSIEGIVKYQSFQKQIRELNTKTQGYGITGLLSLNFIICLVAAMISAFSFSAIIMERRRTEFAILRAIGAKKSHVYKMAMGENALMMLTASLWGIFIGTGNSYLFNGVFSFIGPLTGTGSALERIIIIPIVELLLISFVTFIGMLLATALSVRSAANQDLSLATKVI